MSKVYNFLYLFKSTINFIITFVIKNKKNILIPNIGIKNVIYIDPLKIKYINSIPLKFNKSTDFIFDFEWGNNNQLLTTYEKKHHTYKSCNQIFLQNIKIIESKEYIFFKNQIKKNKIYKGCKDEKDIMNYFNNLKFLYKSILKNGLRENRNNNIEFMIDREYNLVKINSGNHRFAISRILKLKKIPIEIKLIHISCFKKNKDQIKLLNIEEVISRIQLEYA